MREPRRLPTQKALAGPGAAATIPVARPPRRTAGILPVSPGRHVYELLCDVHAFTDLHSLTGHPCSSRWPSSRCWATCLSTTELPRALVPTPVHPHAGGEIEAQSSQQDGHCSHLSAFTQNPCRHVVGGRKTLRPERLEGWHGRPISRGGRKRPEVCAHQAWEACGTPRLVGPSRPNKVAGEGR